MEKNLYHDIGGRVMKTTDLKELFVNGVKIGFERSFISINDNGNDDLDWNVYLYGASENDMIDFFTNESKVNLRMINGSAFCCS